MPQLTLEEIQKKAGDEPSGQVREIFTLTWDIVGKDNLLIVRHDGRFTAFDATVKGLLVFDSLEAGIEWAAGEKAKERKLCPVFSLEKAMKPLSIDPDKMKYYEGADYVTQRLNWPLADWTGGHQYAVSFLKKEKSKEAAARGQNFSYVVPKVIDLTAGEEEYIVEGGGQ